MWCKDLVRVGELGLRSDVNVGAYRVDVNGKLNVLDTNLARGSSGRRVDLAET